MVSFGTSTHSNSHTFNVLEQISTIFHIFIQVLTIVIVTGVILLNKCFSLSVKVSSHLFFKNINYLITSLF